jgi:hypothetical protein
MFRFERPGLPVPLYQLQIFENGGGQYWGEEMPMTVGHADPPPSPQPFSQRGFSVSPTTATKVYALARSLNRFNIACASTAKNVADTGKKTLTYSGMNSVIGSCEYNYTENKDVQALTDIFEGIAETMDEGRRLDYLHRYDRLGLDAAISFLTQEVSAGRALELGTIATTLRSIADDAEVIERVRMRARALLTLVPAQTRQPMQ